MVPHVLASANWVWRSVRIRAQRSLSKSTLKPSTANHRRELRWPACIARSITMRSSLEALFELDIFLDAVFHLASGRNRDRARPRGRGRRSFPCPRLSHHETSDWLPSGRCYGSYCPQPAAVRLLQAGLCLVGAKLRPANSRRRLAGAFGTTALPPRPRAPASAFRRALAARCESVLSDDPRPSAPRHQLLAWCRSPRVAAQH